MLLMCCYTLKVPALASYYKSRRIPMCELYELYVEDKFDWNEQCEGGDCYKILQYHRDKFVNYKTTWRQVWWLVTQFLSTCGVVQNVFAYF